MGKEREGAVGSYLSLSRSYNQEGLIIVPYSILRTLGYRVIVIHLYMELR